MIFSSRIYYSIILYVLLLTLLYIQKPSIIFNDDNTLKNFGLNNNDSIYTLGTFTVLLAFVSFYFFAMLDFIFRQ